MSDISRIIKELEQQRTAIDRALKALRDIGGSTGTPKAVSESEDTRPTAAPKKRRLSAAGRQRIAEAARQRWAAKRAATKKKRGPKKATE